MERLTSDELTSLFWDEHFRNKTKEDLPTKIKQKVYDWLNKDNFGGFEVDGEVFWIEKCTSYSSLPNYIFKYLKQWAKRKGYKYLYEVAPA